MSDQQIVYGRNTGRYINPNQHPLDFAKCGTEANARAPRRRGETPCRECKQADARAKAQRRERQQKQHNGKRTQ